MSEVVILSNGCSMNNMNNTNTNFRSLVNEMIAEQRAYATITFTDDEIADHVALRLAMMMCEAAKA